MKEIKHIIFDIGNVLNEWDSELAFLDQIPIKKSADGFLSMYAIRLGISNKTVAAIGIRQNKYSLKNFPNMKPIFERSGAIGS